VITTEGQGTRSVQEVIDRGMGKPLGNVGRYSLVRPLGRGGMADVFLARTKGLEDFQRDFAVKRILPKLADDERALRMFLDEARVTVAMQHPNIVQVYDLGGARGDYFIVMEYVDGMDLRRLITACDQAGATFPYKHTLLVVSEALKALSYAHTVTGQDGQPLNIVHQDISPANIMVARSGAVKLSDFGVARAAITKWKRDPSEILGKYRYFAPEVVRGGAPSSRSDIFALAAVLYELVTGESLLVGTNFDEVYEELLQFSAEEAVERDPSIPEPLEPILLKALAAHPAVRYATAAEFLDDLTDHIVEDRIRLSASDLAAFITLLEGAVTSLGAEAEMEDGDPPSLTLELLDDDDELPGDAKPDDDEEETDRRRWIWPVAKKATVFSTRDGFLTLGREDLADRAVDGRLAMRTLVQFAGGRWRPLSSFLEGGQPTAFRTASVKLAPLRMRKALAPTLRASEDHTAVLYSADEVVALGLGHQRLLGIQRASEKGGLLGAAERAGLINRTQSMVVTHLAGADEDKAIETLLERKLVQPQQLEPLAARRLAAAMDSIFRRGAPSLFLVPDPRPSSSHGADFDTLLLEAVRTWLPDAHLTSTFASRLDTPLKRDRSGPRPLPFSLSAEESALLKPAIDSMTVRDVLGMDWFDAPSRAYRALYLLMEFGMLKFED